MPTYSRFFVLVLIFISLVSACQQNVGDKHTSVAQNPVRDSIPFLAYSVDYIMGKFTPEDDTNFVMIDPEYSDEPGMYLRKEAYEAFIAMRDSARREGIDLEVISATRNFERQKQIWESKWTGKRKLSDGTDASKIASDSLRAIRILEYSSMPGSSRHHWGTDIDINALNNDYFRTGKGKREYTWLQENAGRFGYCQSYTEINAERPTGYFEEKWHWSYKPLSGPLTEWVKLYFRDTMISGFAGAETAEKIGIVEKYMLGISESCLD